VTSYERETRRLSRLVAANVGAIAIASLDCDVVHCVVEPYAVPAAIAGLIVRRPLIVTIHGTYAVRPFRRPGARWWYEFAYRRAARLIAVSRYTRGRLPSRFGAKAQVVPEGVDHEAFATVPKAEGNAWRPHPSTAPYLLSVGPVKRRNGYTTTLEAFAQVRAQFPGLEYRIAGGTDDPTFLSELRSRIASMGLVGAVHLMGRVADDELLALYHGCELFWLLPEDDGEQFHGFGLVYWEANACGKAVIGARDSGAGDAIAPGTNGLLVPSGDATGAAAAAVSLLDNPARLAEMGVAARTYARPWRDAARLMSAQYADLAGRAGTTATPPPTL
jgi:phosphatidylinositol alpha-1,6-mannosyltransferase